ncbi:Uncharacterised protein [Vibrio cholerae]|nr:Uncharacterised protein [Vibrio cholerae]
MCGRTQVSCITKHLRQWDFSVDDFQSRRAFIHTFDDATTTV